MRVLVRTSCRAVCSSRISVGRRPPPKTFFRTGSSFRRSSKPVSTPEGPDVRIATGSPSRTRFLTMASTSSLIRPVSRKLKCRSSTKITHATRSLCAAAACGHANAAPHSSHQMINPTGRPSTAFRRRVGRAGRAHPRRNGRGPFVSRFVGV